MSDELLVNQDPKIALMLTCADWRLHRQEVDLNARIARMTGSGGVDLIVVPGPDGLISPDRAGEWAAVVSQIKLLITAHKLAVLLVAGHQRCAGHPVSDEAHVEDVRQTAIALKRDTGFVGPIHAIMLVYHSDLAWDVEPVAVI